MSIVKSYIQVRNNNQPTTVQSERFSLLFLRVTLYFSYFSFFTFICVIIVK